MENEEKEFIEEVEYFDIAEEFRITDEMEAGKEYPLTKDASITIRSFQSKTYLKGVSKLKEDNPEKTDTELLIMSIAKYGIVDNQNVVINGKIVENTYESRMEALEFQSDEDSKGPFVMFVLTRAQIKNFDGAGSSLMQNA